MLRDAKEFKKSMLEAKHELELELTPAGWRRAGAPGARRPPSPSRPRAPSLRRRPAHVGDAPRPRVRPAHGEIWRRSRGFANLRDQGLSRPGVRGRARGVAGPALNGAPVPYAGPRPPTRARVT